jgi:hypothetical protein
LNRSAVRDFNIVSEARGIIVDVQDFQVLSPFRWTLCFRDANIPTLNDLQRARRFRCSIQTASPQDESNRPCNA